MLLEQVENPKISGAKENIVRLTMTLDQFRNLKDCVSLAWQSAEKDSRMFLITTMIRDDFVKLTLDDGKDKEIKSNKNVVYKLP